jgi:hypothetical protein
LLILYLKKDLAQCSEKDTVLRMGIRGQDLSAFQEILGVSDEQVAARVKRSSATFRRAKKDLASEETKTVFAKALEALRPERLNEITNFPRLIAG